MSKPLPRPRSWENRHDPNVEARRRRRLEAILGAQPRRPAPVSSSPGPSWLSLPPAR